MSVPTCVVPFTSHVGCGTCAQVVGAAHRSSGVRLADVCCEHPGLGAVLRMGSPDFLTALKGRNRGRERDTQREREKTRGCWAVEEEERGSMRPRGALKLASVRGDGTLRRF